MDDKVRNKLNSNNGGQVDHVDSILNEFMQNRDRRNNYGLNDWLEPPHQEQQFPEWHPEQQYTPEDRDPYYLDYGAPEQNPPYQNYDVNQQSQYYGDMPSRYMPHEPMNNSRSQPTRLHIQQVHPRNSMLHTTHAGIRPPPSHPVGYPRGASMNLTNPSNLLVHQQYRSPLTSYQDRYQHAPLPPQQTTQQYTQPTQQYSNMSNYDLSAHVRSQGALNWSNGNVQMSANNPTRMHNTNQTNRSRYPQQPNQPAYNPPAPQAPNASANFMGNNATRPITQPQANQRNSNPTAPPPILNRNNDMAGRDIELEQLIYRNAKAILAETANRCLKSVELANALRDRIGKEALQRTKVLYGGLLVLLELYRETFAVHRIPKNDMVELLAYVPPQYASHSIQHPQQLLASQIPGYSISAPNLASNNSSFPNGTLISSNGTDSKSTGLSSEPPQTLYQVLTKQQAPTKCLFISNVPDDITGNQIWTEFGGEDIVERVSVDFQDEQRTGIVWFTSVNAAKAALNIPALVKWKDVLSFVDPKDVEVALPPTETSDQHDSNDSQCTGSNYTPSTTSSQPSFDDNYGPPPGLTDQTPSSYLPSGRNLNTFFDVSVTMGQEGRFQHQNDLMVDLSSLGISSNENISNDPELSTVSISNTDSPKGSFRKAAPPPIVTTDLAPGIENPTPKSMTSLSPGSPSSTPGGTPHLSFTFFDSSAPGGITTLPRETLPKQIHDVMNTLCDIYYVPQKTWEKSPLGDYLFCQAIVDILSGQFNGVFVQMTKLKQQLKRKLGGSIRIGPLKALVIAYPEYFEVDRTVNLVRSLKSELPYMDISVITSA